MIFSTTICEIRWPNQAATVGDFSQRQQHLIQRHRTLTGFACLLGFFGVVMAAWGYSRLPAHLRPAAGLFALCLCHLMGGKRKVGQKDLAVNKKIRFFDLLEFVL